MKYFRFDVDYIMWQVSYTNLAMCLATIPVYDEDEEKEKGGKTVEGVDQLSDFFNSI